MRKIKAEAIKSLPNLPANFAEVADRLAAEEAKLEAARKELDAKKTTLFARLVESYGYNVLNKAGVL